MAGVKSSISFGMVYIPIKLYNCIKPNDISFNQLEKNTKSRVRYKKTCEDCGGKTISNDQIIRAYQYEKDRYVVFEDEDFEKIKTEKDKTIVIEQFVRLSEIDPVYFNKQYYVLPTSAEKAFCLLKDSIKAKEMVGIAKTVLGQKETLVALRENGGHLMLSTLFFSDEVQMGAVQQIKAAVTKQEQDMAAMIIDNMTRPFEPEQFKDEYNERVRQAIEAKLAGEEITVPRQPITVAVDLMDALRKSVISTQNKNQTESKKSAAAKNSGQSAAKTTKKVADGAKNVANSTKKVADGTKKETLRAAKSTAKLANSKAKTEKSAKGGKAMAAKSR